MLWSFPNPAQHIITAAALLTEWEQHAQPALSEAYSHARAGFLAQLQLLSPLMLPTVAVNVDEADIRKVLSAQSLRIGSGRAGGPERAAHATRITVEDTQRNLLGPPPTGPANSALLYIASGPAADLELAELTTITEYVQDVFGQNLEVVFGHDTDPALGTELEVCLLLGYGLPLTSAPVARPRPTIPPEEVFPAAVRLIAEYQIVSGSLLQRHLATGYNRTCQLLKELEAAGVIWRREDGGYGVVNKEQNSVL